VFEGAKEMKSDLARVLAALTTGIYVLTVNDHGRHHGMSSSWVTLVSGTPPLFMAAVDNGHHSCAVIARTGIFGLNIVGTRAKGLEDYFLSAVSKRPDNLRGLDYDLSPRLSVPWLRRAMASVEAGVVASHAAGDHTMFVAEPVGVRVLDDDRPLTSLDLDYVYLGGKEVVRRYRSGR
jgi:flavin reductase (DIM6/NTAB) family NADH-FMN oxidoreductase RutF